MTYQDYEIIDDLCNIGKIICYVGMIICALIWGNII